MEAPSFRPRSICAVELSTVVPTALSRRNMRSGAIGYERRARYEADFALACEQHPESSVARTVIGVKSSTARHGRDLACRSGFPAAVPPGTTWDDCGRQGSGKQGNGNQGNGKQAAGDEPGASALRGDRRGQERALRGVHRYMRMYTVCHLPNRAGSPRHLQPCSATWRIAFNTVMFASLTFPRALGSSGAIRSYCAAVSSISLIPLSFAIRGGSAYPTQKQSSLCKRALVCVTAV